MTLIEKGAVCRESDNEVKVNVSYNLPSPSCWLGVVFQASSCLFF